MKIMMIFVLVGVFGGLVSGQEGKAINVGRIHTSDKEVIDGQHMVIAGDSVEYYLKGSSSRYIMGLNRVNKIQEYRGHHGNRGMWIGSIIGGAAGLGISLATIETERTNVGVGYIEETKIQLWPILVFTTAGSVFGYLIGKNSQSWDTVYKQDIAWLNKLEMHSNPNQGGFLLTYRLNL